VAKNFVEIFCKRLSRRSSRHRGWPSIA